MAFTTSLTGVSKANKQFGKANLTVYRNLKFHLLAFESFRKEKITFDSFDFASYEDLSIT